MLTEQACDTKNNTFHEVIDNAADMSSKPHMHLKCVHVEHSWSECVFLAHTHETLTGMQGDSAVF